MTEGGEIASLLGEYESKLKGISFLPRSEDVYPQMPYEAISESVYRAAAGRLKGASVKGGAEAIGEGHCDACA